MFSRYADEVERARYIGYFDKTSKIESSTDVPKYIGSGVFAKKTSAGKHSMLPTYIKSKMEKLVSPIVTPVGLSLINHY